MICYKRESRDRQGRGSSVFAPNGRRGQALGVGEAAD